MMPTYPKELVHTKPAKAFDDDTFQLGRIEAPARITRCGWPGDQDKSFLGGLAVIHDSATIDHIKMIETQLQKARPDLALNSVITKMAVDNDTKDETPIVRLKFLRSQHSLMVTQYGTSGDAQPTRDPPTKPADMRNGHLFVAIITPRSWVYEGSCGITLLALKVNCLGHHQQAEPPVEWQ